jgi:16S rRNA (uracil1498-N3)-methyltransferase
MRRFFTNKENIRGDMILLDSKTDIHHIKNVLRMKAGGELDIVCTSDSTAGVEPAEKASEEYHCQIESLEGEEIVLSILDKNRACTELPQKITVFQCLPKSSKLEDVAEDLTELGISELVPVLSSRCVSDKLSENKRKRIEARIAAAAKQARRTLVPAFGELVSFEEMCQTLKNYDLSLICYEDEKHASIASVLAAKLGGAGSVAIIIGPEGGFDSAEVELAATAGALSVGLTKSILRTETAGVVCTSMLIYELLRRELE